MEGDLQQRVAKASEGVDAEFLALMTRKDGWEDLGEEEAVRGSQFFLPDGSQVIRSQGVIARSAEIIKNYVADSNNKRHYDEMLDQTRTVVEFEPNLKVVHERFNAPWPVSQRDFVFWLRIFERPDGFLFVTKSIDAGVPEADGVVRGEINIGGMMIKRLDDSNSLVTYLVSTNLKGSIPSMIANTAGKKQAGNVRRLRNAILSR